MPSLLSSNGAVSSCYNAYLLIFYGLPTNTSTCRLSTSTDSTGLHSSRCSANTMSVSNGGRRVLNIVPIFRRVCQPRPEHKNTGCNVYLRAILEGVLPHHVREHSLGTETGPEQEETLSPFKFRECLSVDLVPIDTLHLRAQFNITALNRCSVSLASQSLPH